MSRATVRIAVQSFLTNLNLPYVGTVYAARTYISETDYDSVMVAQASEQVPAGDNYGCVLVVNIPTDTRRRIADTGRGSVNDFWIHNIALELFFADTSGNPIPAQQAYDSIVDAVNSGVRSDPLLGSGQGGVIWSAAEFQEGITHTQSEPFTDDDGQTVFIVGTVRFEAWEQMVGTGI